MANEKEPSASSASTETTEQPAPKFMTAEDFNGAMTARERRFEERMAKQMAAQLEKFWAARSAPATDAGEETGTEADAADAAQTAAVEQPKRLSGDALAIKKAAAKIDALQKQMQAKEEAAAKEKAELLQRQEKADMLAALTAAGVTTAKGAYATLKEDGRIRRNADGELVMVVVKDYAGTKAEEEVPIAAGIKEWLATDDGKCFLPPRGGGDGSATVIRGGASRTGSALSKDEAKREAQKALTQFVLGGR